MKSGVEPGKQYKTSSRGGNQEQNLEQDIEPEEEQETKGVELEYSTEPGEEHGTKSRAWNRIYIQKKSRKLGVEPGVGYETSLIAGNQE